MFGVVYARNLGRSPALASRLVAGSFWPRPLGSPVLLLLGHSRYSFFTRASDGTQAVLEVLGMALFRGCLRLEKQLLGGDVELSHLGDSLSRALGTFGLVASLLWKLPHTF